MGCIGWVGQIKLGRCGWGRKEKGPAADLGREGRRVQWAEMDCCAGRPENEKKSGVADGLQGNTGRIEMGRERKI
jgi:hypothetical protein